MMRLAVFGLLFAALPLRAQAPADTGAMAHHREHAQAEWSARLRDALGLSDDQLAKLQATREHFRTERRTLFQHQREVFMALRGQLRPGVAANADSVRKLLDAREAGLTAFATLRRDEEHEMGGYLTPVQLARLDLMRARFRFRHMRGRGREHWQHDGDGADGHGNWPRGGRDRDGGDE